jgi:hypothetical protein
VFERQLRGLLGLSESRSPGAVPEPPRECCSFVKPAVTVWMSHNRYSREAVTSAHGVVDVRPLRRPTAEVELRAAEPALDCLEPELRDRDR